MNEIHNDVELQPLTGESLRHSNANTDQDPRADIRVRGFWTQGSNAFFGTRVFYFHRQAPVDLVQAEAQKELASISPLINSICFYSPLVMH